MTKNYGKIVSSLTSDTERHEPTRKLRENYNYTHKIYKGQLISDDRWDEQKPIERDQEKKRNKLIDVCEQANVTLKLLDPRIVKFPDSKQLRSTFYVSGNYPDWYFYQTVNQVKPMPLDKI